MAGEAPKHVWTSAHLVIKIFAWNWLVVIIYAHGLSCTLLKLSLKRVLAGFWKALLLRSAFSLHHYFLPFSLCVILSETWVGWYEDVRKNDEDKMKTRPEGLAGTPEQGHMYISVRSRLHIYDRYAHNFILIPMYKLDHLPPSIQLKNELCSNK